MSISEAELSLIEGTLTGRADAPALAELRQHLTGRSITRCDASDMTETPFREFPGYELHLISSADHCVTFTQDPATATGIVLARKANRP